MKITKIECFVLLMPDYRVDANSSAQDNLVVKIHTDEGHVGIGETDTNPWVARAMIEARGTHAMGLGLTEMLIGADPSDVEGLWEKMYKGSAMTGRRGLGICAIGALDMALWDLRGKVEGKPCWQLLGGAVNPVITPYASLLPEGDDLETYTRILVERAEKAKALGFRAVKLEVCTKGPYSHNSLQIEDDREIARIVAACRKAIGPEMTVMVDVAYAWRDWKEALRAMEMFADQDIFFIETPLPSDDVEGYAKLVKASPMRVAAGEWLNTRFEFLELFRAGGLDVAQPDVGRVGGLTEARRVAMHAADHGLARRAALLEVGDRHRSFGASVGSVADLHPHRIPAARTRRFPAADRALLRRTADRRWPHPAADQTRPRRHHRRKCPQLLPRLTRILHAYRSH